MLNVDQIIEQLKEKNEATLVRLWNDVGAALDWRKIYADNEDINEIFTTPLEAVRAVHFGDYDYLHNYYSFDNYGNLVSYNSLDANASPFDYEELAEYFKEHGFGDFEDEFDTSDDDDDDSDE